MAEETKRKKFVVEPSEFQIRGIMAEELLSKEFLTKLKDEFPTAQVEHVCFLFSDSKERLMVGHESKERKMIPDYLTIAASESKLAKRLLEVLRRLFA